MNLFAQGYEIKLNVKGLKTGQAVNLGHHFVDKWYLDDTAIVDKQGWAVFKKNEPLPGGMYFMHLPNKTYFDFFVDKEQKMTIESDTLDLVKNMKFTGSVDNTIASDFQRFMSQLQSNVKRLQDEKAKAAGNDAKIKEIDGKLNQIQNDYLAYFDKVIAENPKSFFVKFLKANRDVVIPASVTKDEDRGLYYKYHYFDDFDVSDPRLLRTPIFESKINTYLDKWCYLIPDSLIKEVDFLLDKALSSNNKELIRYMLVSLFNKYTSSKLITAENVYVHIADKYYIKYADWSEKDYLKELKNKVRRKKNCLIGNTAKNMDLVQLFNDSLQIRSLQEELVDFKKKGILIQKDSIKTSKEVRLQKLGNLIGDYYSHFQGYVATNQVKAKYTIIWFWDPTCSHCTVETPKLYTCYTDTLKAKGVNVISVFLTKDVDDWDKFTNHIDDWYKFIIKHKMYKWTNVWSVSDPFRENYDLSSSPVLYLLDENKKILAKNISYEQAKEFIENLIKEDNEKNKKK